MYIMKSLTHLEVVLDERIHRRALTLLLSGSKDHDMKGGSFKASATSVEYPGDSCTNPK